MIEDIDPETAAWFERHCAAPGGVIIAHRIFPDGGFESAVFSNLEKAHIWVDELDDEGSVLFVPHIIDVPDYGNVPKGDMN